MKKTLLILSSMALSLFLIQSISAEVLLNQGGAVTTAANAAANKGKDVTIDTSNVGGAPALLTFAPSTGVVMSGATDSTSFAIAAHNNNVNQKKAGQQYGMAGDTNKMYFRNIETVAAEYMVSGDTNTATAFAGWATM